MKERESKKERVKAGEGPRRREEGAPRGQGHFLLSPQRVALTMFGTQQGQVNRQRGESVFTEALPGSKVCTLLIQVNPLL